MKVHLIKKVTIEDFVSKNAASKKSFNIWLSIIKRANWNDPLDIIDTFNSADILGNGTNRVVFNVGGNKYRVYVPIILEKRRFIYLLNGLNGLVHMQNIQRFATKTNNIQLKTIKRKTWIY